LKLIVNFLANGLSIESYTKNRYDVQLQYLVEIFHPLSNDKFIRSNQLLDILLGRFDHWARMTTENKCSKNYRNLLIDLLEVFIKNENIKIEQLRTLFKSMKTFGDETILSELMKRVSIRRNSRNIELFRFLYIADDASYKVKSIRNYSETIMLFST